MRREAATNNLPASVRVICRFDRINNRTFKCASSSETLRLIVANGTLSFRDAAEMLPASETASKADIASSRSIVRFPNFGRYPPSLSPYGSAWNAPRVENLETRTRHDEEHHAKQNTCGCDRRYGAFGVRMGANR